MNIKSHLFLCTLLFAAAITSCTKEYTSENLLNDILSNNSESIIDNFYNSKKLDKEAFKKTVHDYSVFLNENNFTKVVYKDSFNFKRKDRYGYYFLNEDNNFVASITYKYVMLQDSSYQLNFIDFRNSTHELPCIKFPSRFPIKCVGLPMDLPLQISKIDAEYPKTIDGHRFHHVQRLSPSNLMKTGDTLKTPIQFNTGNKIISRNIKSILKVMEKSINLNDYTLAETSTIGEPIINITYYPGAHDQETIKAIENAVVGSVDAKVKLIARKGPIYTTGLVKGFFEPITIGFLINQNNPVFR